MTIDVIDAKILEVLQENARISYSELSKRINLSLSAVSDRLKKMEASGLISSYTTILDPAALDRQLQAYMMVNVDSSGNIDDLLTVINDADEVLEAHFVAGDFDYMLKIATRNTATLADLVNRIKAVKSVKRTETTIILTDLKQRYSVPPVANRQ
ncbi:MAG: Lrp/AsnC family transcriptional regulator [Firmicutes bacterium]|nr:Lrp/AsnC family transcriptional regulator [Bacillota bacterium]